MHNPVSFTIQTPLTTIAEEMSTQKARCRKRKAEEDPQVVSDGEVCESRSQDVITQDGVPENKGLHPMASFNLLRERVLYSVHTTLREKLRAKHNFAGKMHQMTAQMSEIEAKTQETYDETNKLLDEEAECMKTLETINHRLNENASGEVLVAELEKLKSQLTSPHLLLMLRQSMLPSSSYVLPIDQQGAESPVVLSETSILSKNADPPMLKTDVSTSATLISEKPKGATAVFPAKTIATEEKDGRSNPFGLFGKQEPTSKSSSDKFSFPGIPKSTESTDSLKAFGKPSNTSVLGKVDTTFSFGASKASDNPFGSLEKKVEPSKSDSTDDKDPLSKKPSPFGLVTDSSKPSGEPVVKSDSTVETSKLENPFNVFGKPSFTSNLDTKATPFSFGAPKITESTESSEGSVQKKEEPSKSADPFGNPSFASAIDKKESPFSFGAQKATDSVQSSGDMLSDPKKTEEQPKPESPFNIFGKPAATGTLEKKETPFSFGASTTMDSSKASDNSFGNLEKRAEPSKSADKEPLSKKPSPFGPVSSTQESANTTSQGLFSISKPVTFGGSTNSMSIATGGSSFSNPFASSTENKETSRNAAPAFGSNPFGQTLQTPLTPADASSAFIQAFQTNTPTIPPTSPQNGFGAPASNSFSLPQNPGESLFQLSPQTFDSTQGAATGSLKPTRRFGDQGKRKRR